MNRISQTILVIGALFWALPSHASTPESLRIFDVTQVRCESGARPDFYRVFPPGAVVQMKTDVIAAFAKANSNQDIVILKYPIAKEGLDPSAPPPCQRGDTLLVEMKKHIVPTPVKTAEEDTLDKN